LQLLVPFKLQLPLWRRVEHLVRLKTDSAILSASALVDEACESYNLRF